LRTIDAGRRLGSRGHLVNVDPRPFPRIGRGRIRTSHHPATISLGVPPRLRRLDSASKSSPTPTARPTHDLDRPDC
jgi:hypothetical protein